MSTHEEQPPLFDFEAHRLKAIAEYQKLRPMYADTAEVVRKILNEAFGMRKVRVHSVEARAKEIDSLGRKAIEPSDTDPNKPKYPRPMTDVTDLSGVRVITFFLRTLDAVGQIIQSEFDVIEKSDKADELIREEKFGYRSIHYLVRLKDNRTSLLEYGRFKGMITEVQVRTILQHAWAEIEHDIQYESVDTIPNSIRRRFMSLAGMLEIGDREFQAIQDEDLSIRKRARVSVQQGKLDEIEITPDALRAYLDKKLGSDGRVSGFSYEWTARMLRVLGFTDFRQVEECVHGFDDDQLSRIAWGARQGQITRFELMLLAGMGKDFTRYHMWHGQDWFVQRTNRQISALRAEGIIVRNYLPPSRRRAEPASPHYSEPAARSPQG